MDKRRKQPKTPEDLTLTQIMSRFSTDDQAREYLEGVRWPEGPVCPHCGNCDGTRIYALKADMAKKIRAGLYQCAECDKQFTVTVGTIFADSKVPLSKWLVAWYLLCSSKKGFSALQLQRSLELGSYRTAWFMFHRIRYAMSDPVFTGKLGGIVEADETYIGGKIRGHGQGNVENKTPVVTILERGGRVRSVSMPKVTGRNLKAAFRQHVDASARVFTDQSTCYKGLNKEFADHQTVNHTAAEYVRGEITTNTVEGFFANLQRGVEGVYHHVGKGNLDQYLGEFDFRYNTRAMSDGERTIAGLRKVEGKRLMLRRPARNNG